MIPIMAATPVTIPGRIKSVKVVNFINHDNAVVEFNNSITFITGLNGSGKSAILAAVLVALGGRASTADRGDSLYTLIKRGRQFAEVTVTLENSGPDPFEIEKFGKAISITRYFNLNKRNTYSIRGRKSGAAVIYKTKEKVTAIVEHFNIQINNSFTFMTQDTSRTFLKASSDKERYDLFFKGVQLNLVEEYYNDVKEVRNKVAHGLERAREALGRFEDERRVAEEKLNSYTETLKRHKTLRSLECESAWCDIAEAESVVDDLKNVLESLQGSLAKKQEQRQQIQDNSDNFEEKVKKLAEEKKGMVNELQTKNKERNTLNEHYKGKKSELSKLDLKLKSLGEQLASAQQEQQQYEMLRDNLTSASGDGDPVKAKAKQDMDNLERRKAHLLESVDMLRGEMVQYRGDMEERERSVRQMIEQKQIQLASCSSLQRQISELKQADTDQLFKYGRATAPILQAIESAVTQRKFKYPPIGPLGRHIKVLDAQWSLAVEEAIGGSLCSYVVRCDADKNVLRQIFTRVCRDCKVQEPWINVIGGLTEGVIDVSNKRPAYPQHSTVYDVIQVDSQLVLNALLELESPNRKLLVPSVKDAIPLLKAASGTQLNNLAAVYTKHGDYHKKNAKNNQISSFSGQREKSYIFATTSRQQQQEDARELKERLQSEKRQIPELEQKVKEEKQTMKQREADMARLEKEMARKRNELNRCDNTMDELKLQIERDETAEVQREMERVLASVTDLQSKLEALESAKESCGEETRVLSERVSQYDSELKVVADRVKALSEDYEQRKKSQAKSEQRISDLKRQCDELARKIASVESRHAAESGRLERLEESVSARRDQLPERPRGAAVRKKGVIELEIRKVKSLLQMESNMDISERQLRGHVNRLKGAKSKVDMCKVAIAEKDREFREQTAMMKERYRWLSDLRDFFSLKTNEMFRELLSLRQMTGQLEFDHKVKKLRMECRYRGEAERQRSDIKNLSGGETSFSTVCLLLSMWKCIKCPLVMVDECDVNMDVDNRNLTFSQILRSAALEYAQCGGGEEGGTPPGNAKQYVLLTPLEQPRIPPEARKYVSFIKMIAPVRCDGNDDDN